VRTDLDLHRIESTGTAFRNAARRASDARAIVHDDSRENAMKHAKYTIPALAITLALAACDSGSNMPSNGNNDRQFGNASAEGAYGGNLTGSLFSNFIMVVLEDATFWLAYGRPLVGPLAESGFIEGTGTSTSTTHTFTSADAVDFGLVPPAPATITATYSTAPSISGSIVYDTATVLFDGASPITGTTYSYATPASMATVLGAWTLTSNAGVATPINIAASGTLSATDASGCAFTGSIAPRASGKNVYNVSLTFGATCPVPNTAMTGIALALPIVGGKTELLLMAMDSTRGFGYGATGTR
jgi:hypothetical protein